MTLFWRKTDGVGGFVTKINSMPKDCRGEDIDPYQPDGVAADR